ncbi:MAG: YihY family inner membrane protein [Rubrivivax sp.]|nr:YihY family inner membrane protein [Rubrivivax sp.]
MISEAGPGTEVPAPAQAPAAHERLARLAASLRQWPWFETLRTLRRRFREDALGLTAGSLTFTTLITLVPLLTVMLAIFAAFPMFASFQVALEKYFLQALVPDNIARPVLKSLTAFAGKARTIGAAGFALLLVSALALMLTIDRTLNRIWRVRRERPLGQRVLVYWAGLTLGPLVLGVSLSAGSYAISASQGWASALPGGVGFVIDLLEFALLATMMAGLFHYVPNTPVRWVHAWAGALFVAVAMELAKSGLAWYLKAIPSISVIYGAFATAPILLLWIYLLWVVVLLGAVVAAYAPSLAMRVVRRPDAPGQRFELALQLLAELDGARRAGVGGLTLTQLATRLRADPLQLEPVIHRLGGIDWVGWLREARPAARTPHTAVPSTGAAAGQAGERSHKEDAPGAEPRLVLLCEPAAVPAARLIDALLLAPSEATRSFRRHARIDELTLAQVLAA